MRVLKSKNIRMLNDFKLYIKILYVCLGIILLFSVSLILENMRLNTEITNYKQRILDTGTALLVEVPEINDVDNFSNVPILPTLPRIK